MAKCMTKILSAEEYAKKFIKMCEKEKNGCLIFNKKKQKYPSFWFNGYKMLAHRYSYQTFVGEIPLGNVVMHVCDNPYRVNPKHLRAGTQSENVKDMYIKNRNKKHQGQFCPHSSLTFDLYKKIFAEYFNGTHKYIELSKKFGIDPQTISWAIRGKTYKVWRKEIKNLI